MGGVILVFKRIIKTVRYRFFLFAGLFPYLLGQVLAFNLNRYLNWQNFWWGFLGVILVLMGVELFNEYFDAKAGGDRIFLKEKPQIPDYFLLLALSSMLFAFFIGLYLASKSGWPILLFSVLGFLGAYFYVGPPLRWAYRGLGEFVIALSYGPFMLLGSYYLQTKRIDTLPILVSLILGLLIFSLAIVNEIPDYYQDKLVGKRNLVVRLGKQGAVKLFSLCLISIFILIGIGIGFQRIPSLSIFAFLLLPGVYKNINMAKGSYDQPESFLPVIRATLFTYIIMVSLLGISYLGG
ncbi:MAG: prenyltransferase [Candidatus Omnitrophota bacterium]|nr:prenyltransferase [Candidatus Omnitrophota bacterium]